MLDLLHIIMLNKKAIKLKRQALLVFTACVNNVSGVFLNITYVSQ